MENCGCFWYLNTLSAPEVQGKILRPPDKKCDLWPECCKHYWVDYADGQYCPKCKKRGNR